MRHRGAARHIESGLRPRHRIRTCSCRAAQGAVWASGSASRRSTGRCGDPRRRGSGGELRSRVRIVVAQPRPGGRQRCSPTSPPASLTDADHARLAFLRATNRLFTLADPAGAKKLIDDASHTTPPRARGCIDAFLTVYWAAMGKPEAARESSKNLARDQLPDLVARVTAWAIAVASGDAGRTTEAVAAADHGYAVASRSFDAASHAVRHCRRPRRRTRCCPAGSRKPGASAERLRQQAADLPGSRSATQYRRGRSSRPCCRPPPHRVFPPGTGSRAVDRLGRDQRMRIPLPAATHDCARHARFNR